MWTLVKPSEIPAVQVKKSPTIHFISHLYTTNAADSTFNAGVYFSELFFSYPCIHHRIVEIEFELIKPTDWVIFSGGDIYHPADITLFNKLIMYTGGRVITWGCGYNIQEGVDKFLNKALYKDGFALFTTREYNLETEFMKPERYLPCVSCMQPGLDIKRKILRDVAVIEHRKHPITEFPQYEKQNHSIQALQLLDFIASSNVVITNSYHMVYWATLLYKKVVLVSKYSNKFDYYKHPPAFYSGDLQSDLNKAATYPNALEECRNLNIQFANEVVDIIQADNGELKDLSNIYPQILVDIPSEQIDSDIEIKNIHKRIDEEINSVNKRIDMFHKNIYSLVEQHHKDTNNRINNNHKNVHERIDGLGNTKEIDIND